MTKKRRRTLIWANETADLAQELADKPSIDTTGLLARLLKKQSKQKEAFEWLSRRLKFGKIPFAFSRYKSQMAYLRA